MTPELRELLAQLEAQAEQARQLDSVALMDGCYSAASAALIKTHEELEFLRATVRGHLETARAVLQTSQSQDDWP